MATAPSSPPSAGLTPPPGPLDDAPVPPGAVRRRKWLLRLFMACVVLGGLLFLGRRYDDELGRLQRVSPVCVCVMAGLYLGARAIAAAVRRNALAALGYPTGHLESFMLQMVQAYTNQLIPRGGVGLPALYMKLRHGTSVADFGAVQMLPMTLLQVLAIGVAGLLSQFILWGVNAVPLNHFVSLLFGGLTLGAIVLLKVPLPTGLLGDSRAGLFLARLGDAYQRLGGTRGLFARSVAAHAVTLLLRAARVQLSFHAIGQPVSFMGAFMASLLADLAQLVSVTPAALGIREGVLVYAARFVHTAGDVALAAAVLDRFVAVGCNIMLGQVGMWGYIRPTLEQGLPRMPLARATVMAPEGEDVTVNKRCSADERPAHAQMWDRRPCPSCGYDLRATPGRCPECGRQREPL